MVGVRICMPHSVCTCVCLHISIDLFLGGQVYLHELVFRWVSLCVTKCVCTLVGVAGVCYISSVGVYGDTGRQRDALLRSQYVQ